MSIRDRSRALAMFSANMYFDFYFFLLFRDYLMTGEKVVENGN